MTISKQERLNELRLERKILKRHDFLLLKRSLCNGCGLCVIACPKDALSIKPAIIQDGILLHFPVIEIDKNKCVICGTCATLCPLGALEARINDKKTAMFLENKAIPSLIKNINVNSDFCKPDCGIKCEKSCPRNAIKVSSEIENEQVKKINSVEVDRSLCIYCKACENTCPYGVITVEKPFEGLLNFETEKCPNKCEICIEICPSKVISKKGIKLEVEKELCIFCKACETICPKNAAHINIQRVLHTPIRSATWINMLERFASYKVAAIELVIKSSSKQKSMIKNRFLK